MRNELKINASSAIRIGFKAISLFVVLICLMALAIVANAQVKGPESIWITTSFGEQKGLKYELEDDLQDVYNAWKTYLEEDHGLLNSSTVGEGIPVWPAGIPGMEGELFYELKEYGQGEVSLAVAYVQAAKPDAFASSAGVQLMLKRFIERFLNQYTVNNYTLEIADKRNILAGMQLPTAQSQGTVIVESAGGLEFPQLQQVELIDKLENERTLYNSDLDRYQELKNELKSFSLGEKDFDPEFELQFKMDWIEVDGRSRNAYTAYSELKPEPIEALWVEYARLNLLIEVEEESPGVFAARKVDLAGITEFKTDIVAQFRDFAGGTRMSVAVCPGYDICLNSRDFPSEFNRLRKFLKQFSRHAGSHLGNESTDQERDDRLDETLEEAMTLASEIEERESLIGRLVSDSLMWAGSLSAPEIDYSKTESSENPTSLANYSERLALEREIIVLERDRDLLLARLNASNRVNWGQQGIRPIVVSPEQELSRLPDSAESEDIAMNDPKEEIEDDAKDEEAANVDHSHEGNPIPLETIEKKNSDVVISEINQNPDTTSDERRIDEEQETEVIVAELKPLESPQTETASESSSSGSEVKDLQEPKQLFPFPAQVSQNN